MKTPPPVLKPIYNFHEEAVEVELPIFFFANLFLKFTNQHETVPDSLFKANITPTSAQPIKVKKNCQIRHKLYQCNSKHFTVTSE